MHASFFTLALALAVSAGPVRRADFDLKNGQDAIALNDKFKTLTESSTCQAGENACVGGKFAQCVSGKFVILGCGPGTTCAALPQVNAPGTTIACTTQADIDQRIAATGATNAGGAANNNNNNNNAGNNNAGNNNANNSTDNNAGNANNNAGAGAAAGAGGDPQTSTTLDPKVIATGFASDGQAVPTDGQVASLTSKNNFINFCLTVPNLPITNGKQIVTGSCNPSPIGVIPNVDNMPSSKFTNPVNFGNVTANQKFTITMAINNLVTGNFVNAQENYYAAPQQLDGSGKIIGHTHFVVEKLNDGLGQTKPTDPGTFAFFKGVNGAAVNGVVSEDVADGLPAGAYRVCSINAAANHQPVVAPVAQHGSLDDCSYFTAI